MMAALAILSLVLALGLAVLFVQQRRAVAAADRVARAATEAAQASAAALAEKARILDATLDNINQGLLMVDADRTVPVCNRRALELLELPRDLMQSRPLFDDIVAHQRGRGEFAAIPQYNFPPPGTAYVMTEARTYERRRPNGQVLEVQTIPLSGGGMVRTYTDITERKKSEEQISYFAHHDGLTKLVNRVVFQTSLEDAIELSDRSQRSMAVLYLDLDGFKAVNDTNGHGVGDKVLIAFSQRLCSVVRESDTVARVGGDEFAIIQPLIDGGEAAEQLARRILRTVATPYDVDGTECLIGASIGIALYPTHARTAEALLQAADLAMYRAKASGKAAYCMYDVFMDRNAQQPFIREQDLREALAGRHFELEYQPIVDTASGTVLRYEALLRCRLPGKGVLGPSELIKAAERSGLIMPIGSWVLEAACAAAAGWPESIHLSVNISPLQFTRGDLPGQVAEVLRKTGLAAHRLNLEVTEGVLLEGTKTVVSAMAKLKAMGIRFSLDDFGTAHAGLSYLRRFPFDVIKIDRSFVQAATTQPEERAIVSAIVDIAAAFRMKVVAEGVETEEQLAMMRALRCEQVQGFLTGRPVPDSAVAAQGTTA